MKKDNTSKEKTIPEQMLKSQFIAQLSEVSEFMRILGENEFKIRAFDKATQTLETEKTPLKDIAEGKVKIAGIGEGIKGAISEFLKDGKIKAHEEYSKKIPQAVFDLMKVPGLGPKKAMQLHEELGVTSVGELEYCCRANRLVTLKGFSNATQSKILASIEEMKKRKGKIRLDDAILLNDSILATSKLEICPVGAIIRHSEIVEELEYIYISKTKPKLADLKKLSKELNFIEEQNEFDLDKYIFQSHSEVKVILWYSSKELSNEKLQLLNTASSARQDLLKKPKKYLDWNPVHLEKEWMSSENPLAKETYQVKNHGKVKGFFHCHTTLSDGQNSLEEMVTTAQKLGFEYIGVSDHSQSAFYARGLKPDQIKAQRKEIEKIQDKVGIRIFHGIESDILQEGDLDYTKDVLKSFDFIVGSIHSRFKMDKDQMTKRLVNALSNPHITFWGHATGRLILDRDPYHFDLDACLSAMKKNKVVMELNSNPQRLDMDWRWGPKINQYGLDVSINPDAHSVKGIQDTIFGEWMAEKAALSYKKILNLKSAKEVAAYLSDRK